MDRLVVAIWVVALGVLYFLPGLVALVRHHHNAGAILMLDLLLGWTLIGWVVALVMALTNPPPRGA